MAQIGIILFNAALATAAATAFALGVGGLGADVPGLRAAFLASWWAGLSVGLTVGAGAALGPRPPLGLPKCMLAQGTILLTSAVGAWIGGHFHREIMEVGRAVDGFFVSRGVVLGSWVGAVTGTALEIMHVYRMRRREVRAP